MLEEACKIYYVKLVKGQSFYAFDHRFLMSEEEEVSEKVYNYLRRNEFFEVRKEEFSA
nr:MULTISPECIES: YqbF domain-containing protein [Bacillus]